MPRLTRRQPRYCHHKATGRAVVYLAGKAVYLGPYNSPESKARYKAVLADWLAPDRVAAVEDSPSRPPVHSVLTLAEVIFRYKRHAESYYSGSREPNNLRDALRPVRAMFGRMRAGEFKPAHLRQVREAMVGSGLSRKVVNARINRVRRMFRWAVAEDLVGPDVLARLDAVEALGPGRGGRECPPVRAVSWEAVQATLPHLPEMVRAMVLFGWYTGARPGEVTRLTTGMIDRTKDVWAAGFEHHKNAWRGLSHEVLIGPKAQEILSPWLLPGRPDEPVFSPRRVDDRQAKRKGRRLPGLTYSRCGFGQVIARACRRAGIPSWGPNALRHAAATRLEEQHGLEAAQVALGHAKPDTTLIYTKAAKARAVKAIRQAG